MGLGSYIKDAAVSTCVEYDTPKIVTIHSRSIGILNRIVQLAIILYVVVYVFIVKKGYQHVDTGSVSGTTTKLKGVVYTNSTDPRVGERLWDTADLNVPPEENGAFFLMTNVVVTHNQSQGECASLASSQTLCKTNSDCQPPGIHYHLGHGMSTGVCNQTAGTCMVRAWCPIENDELPADGQYAMLQKTKEFTVFIKNHIYFPYYKKTRSNMLEFIDKSYLHSCKYHHENDPYCPIFNLKDIVSITETKDLAGGIEYDDKWYEELAIRGGVVSIQIRWDCNFDFSETECKPIYQFDRLDNYKGNYIAAGYNYRFPIYYVEDGIHKRELVKAFGILFTLHTPATSRAFDAITCFINIGSGLALLGIAAVCSDIVLLYIHRHKSYFKTHIFMEVDTADTSKVGTTEANGSELQRSIKRSSTEYTTDVYKNKAEEGIPGS